MGNNEGAQSTKKDPKKDDGEWLRKEAMKNGYGQRLRKTVTKMVTDRGYEKQLREKLWVL